MHSLWIIMDKENPTGEKSATNKGSKVVMARNQLPTMQAKLSILTQLERNQLLTMAAKLSISTQLERNQLPTMPAKLYI